MIRAVLENIHNMKDQKGSTSTDPYTQRKNPKEDLTIKNTEVEMKNISVDSSVDWTWLRRKIRS